MVKVLMLELFEGQPERLLPRSYWGSEHDFEIPGTAVPHSILSGGPGFACLHPIIYAQLAVHSILEVEDTCCAEDIPQNAATVDISLIEEVRVLWSTCPCTLSCIHVLL